MKPLRILFLVGEQAYITAGFFSLAALCDSVILNYGVDYSIKKFMKEHQLDGLPVLKESSLW